VKLFVAFGRINEDRKRTDDDRSMADPSGFEGADLEFYLRLTKSLNSETLRLHRQHILRILRSSPDDDAWGGETTMLRAGMRKSPDPDLRSPIKAASVVEGLIASLERFLDDGIEEEWFFDVLSGAATLPRALWAMSGYAILGRPEATARAAQAPAGSDASEIEEERDAALSSADSASEFESTGRPGAIDRTVNYLSTGEAYED